MSNIHAPVLLNESVDLLITDKSGSYFDATLGFGGHSEAILQKLDSKGKLIATDVDENAFNYCKEKFKNDKRVSLYKFNFSMVDVIAKIESLQAFDGILADLGVSSFQLDDPDSGFTFRTETLLDLRMDKTKKQTAADAVNELSEEELSLIFRDYGEERNYKKIARAIVNNREIKKIKTTTDLKKIISEFTPVNYLTKTLSRVFQALRIYVNDELNMLKEFLERSVDVLKPGGRLVVISYHSLEDRIVKDFFRNESITTLSPKEDPFGLLSKSARLKILTKKPLLPSKEEVRRNRRARSAKLRAAERL
ncbi:Putative S-adenosylmethionine-dependent methyltransferase [Ignavibacterium album JCM 16511]|uniref:Ribosomal RNA small subunit methyltransferase H n=1 Tax=Ignavibacterium album (strain DSM 19864 / JCM 16511 / NBRC 101810 / Mat9-16) TaxID=945713 RepID=I0ALR0_IGNAJ|nr:16S rRNA (cytosine(1402)-N(4))-methyltransferase RsmH [Ignavibacterium album]AFH49917.1 Putative S-adenosylmethionine-dependent methyltransferase [Ignavibacterium album JCM 16511]